jgi:prepilin-type N-terminal cleavage/methylation domain-containing protein
VSRRPGAAGRTSAGGGFTLVEVMVVVALVGALGAMAVVMLRHERTTADVATMVGAKVGECVRISSTGGPIRADVLATGLTARARLVIAPAGSGQQKVTIDRLVEDPLPAHTAQWEQTSEVLLGEGIALEGIRNDTALDGGTGPTTVLAVSTTTTLECYADGTTMPRTLFFEGASGKERARIAILSLTGQALVANGW